MLCSFVDMVSHDAVFTLVLHHVDMLAITSKDRHEKKNAEYSRQSYCIHTVKSRYN